MHSTISTYIRSRKLSLEKYVVRERVVVYRRPSSLQPSQGSFVDRLRGNATDSVQYVVES